MRREIYRIKNPADKYRLDLFFSLPSKKSCGFFFFKFQAIL